MYGSVMTRSSLPVGGYSVNPYVGCPHACKYCYASFMKRFTGHTEPWGTFLDVKHWKPIDNPHKYDGQRVVIGSVTDGYNPYEKDFLRTRRLLEELQGSQAEILVCTKSDLVLRDVDLLKQFPRVTVSWSINTLDETFRADMDRAVSIERRLEAMPGDLPSRYPHRLLHLAHLPGHYRGKSHHRTGKGFYRPHLDGKSQLARTIQRDDHVLHPGKHPELYPLYERIYNHRKTDYWQTLEHEMAAYAAQHGFPYRVNDLPYGRSEKGHPTLVNYFYHEKSA